MLNPQDRQSDRSEGSRHRQGDILGSSLELLLSGIRAGVDGLNFAWFALKLSSFLSFFTAVGGVLPLLCGDLDRLRFAGEVWGDSTCSLGRTGHPVVELHSPAKFWFDSTCSKPRTTGRISNPEGATKIENSLTQRSAEWSLFGLGCQFSQHWPRGDEVVVCERFVGPPLVTGYLVEEVGELVGSVADAA